MSKSKSTFSLWALLCASVIAVAGCGEPTDMDADVAQTDKSVNSPKNTETADASHDDSAWLTSYEEAAKISKETGKPILVDFTGSDWCGWCIKLHEEVFSKPEFAAWADENVVLLELDFPRKTKLSAELTAQNEELMKKYEVQGFPTILFLDEDGEKLGKYGYDKGGPEVWTAKAEEIMNGE